MPSTSPPSDTSTSGTTTGEGRILIVDDKRDVLTALRLLLKKYVTEVHTATDPGAITAMLEEQTYDAILLDMNFTQDASSGREGFLWLQRILQKDPGAVVVMITAYGGVEKAVRAMKEGAADFIVKPWNDADLVASVQAAVKLRRSRDAARKQEATDPDTSSTRGPATTASSGDGAASAPGTFDEIIGESPAMQQVYRTIEKVARTDANVLVLGENGTGKELVARAVHRRSKRANASFVSTDLGALSESLFESELFGHIKGSFTGADDDRIGRFEAADGGTLFLDEIGNIPMPLQAKLLTALQRREVTRVGETTPRSVDIRLISATNQPIYEDTQKGQFRQDLLYRINTVEVQLPPLRDRGDDIALLARYYLDEYADRYDTGVTGLNNAACAKLKEYHWPGNVRELKHTVERAVIMAEGQTLEPSDIVFSAPNSPRPSSGSLGVDTLNLDDIEQAAVRKALSKHGGNISRAAEELGISRKALYRRIEKYGL
ncbi:sigma-54-dependent Fis family transcriptional regulator [Longibacter salinarum]|uniref:Sigma-54-dependent Fis family transcriptional regulator n=1 Tax=Longibacter salinarum TaxID=1850348 RepID=A0A2A8CX44_9BACT|nr:sigma-54 dependent transcriptional regulator [Longibacter salinarum]PEN13216.1 sigma-54-dependent Fis family transcriptional regulator [Longibacter salinarum]